MMTRPTTPEVRRDEVRFVSGGLSLSGTITRPADGRRHPGVVILHAAGLDHRADYRVFADSLASWGIVVLAYDMRGTGDSGGKPGIPTFRQLSQDAIAALQLLRAQPDVDARNVGLWALSRGGYTAPLTAVADAGVRFLVVISSPGLPVSVSDSSALVEKAKEHELAAEDVARVERFAGLLLRAARKGGPDYQRLETEFSDVKTQPWFATLQIPAVPPEEALVRYGRTLAFDPDSLWRRVRVPTLLIYGSRDRPRLVRNSRTRILSALAAAGAHVDAPVYAEADHFIRVTREGGEPRFAAGFFASQQRWITANTR
jgi:dienelactone hydrolase